MKPSPRRLHASMAALLLVTPAAADVPGWRTFREIDGLGASASTSIFLSQQGSVLVHHPAASCASELDGYTIETFTVPPSAQRIARTPSGQVWAMASSGLYERSGTNWTLHRIPEIANASAIRAPVPIPFIPIRQGSVLFVVPDGLIEWNTERPEQPKSIVLRDASTLGLGPFQDLAMGRDGSVWILARHGLACYPAPARVFRPDTPLHTFPIPARYRECSLISALQDSSGFTIVAMSNQVPVLLRFDGSAWIELPPIATEASHAWTSPNGAVCIMTAAGVSKFDSAGNETVLFKPRGAGTLQSVAIEPNGAFWITSSDGVHRFCRESWQLDLAATNINVANAPTPQTGHTIKVGENLEWRIDGERLWEFRDQRWTTIRVFPDPILSVLGKPGESPWVATSGAIFQLLQGIWIEHQLPRQFASARIYNLIPSDDGNVRAVTSLGVLRYHRDADRDAPKTRLALSATRAVEQQPVMGEFDGIDRWKQTPAERLLYSHRVGDRPWSGFQESRLVVFAGLPPGKHLVQVRAMDSNGNIEDPPAQAAFTVTVPWHKEARIVTVLIGATVVAMIFAGVAINRHLRLRRSYADIEMKVAERTRQLEVAHRELMHHQKMNALGTLAAGVAHDFNNILSIVKGSAQIIEENLENPEKIKVRVDRVKTVADQGSSIVKAMLGFSRESGEITACRPDEIISDTVRLLGDRFVREVELTTEIQPGLPAVRASKEFVQQILLNFIFNAAESMQASKRIVLTAAEVGTTPSGTILQPDLAKKHVTISVRDFGIGIKPETLPRIFEPFFTTKSMSSRRGTGLGLSMAYELARKMGAGLAVETAPGNGSTFSLILPVDAP